MECFKVSAGSFHCNFWAHVCSKHPKLYKEATKYLRQFPMTYDSELGFLTFYYENSRTYTKVGWIGLWASMYPLLSFSISANASGALHHSPSIHLWFQPELWWTVLCKLRLISPQEHHTSRSSFSLSASAPVPSPKPVHIKAQPGRVGMLIPLGITLNGGRGGDRNKWMRTTTAHPSGGQFWEMFGILLRKPNQNQALVAQCSNLTMHPHVDFSSFSNSPKYLTPASWDNTPNIPNYSQVLASDSALGKPN